jgi:HEAT repeat protein
VRRLLLLAAMALAGTALAESPIEAALQALRKDSSLKVRTQAAIVLGQRGAVEAIPALREAAAEDDAAAVRIAAAGALGKLKARVARTTLRNAAETDGDAAVRAAATRALDALGPVELTIEEATGTASARAATHAALTHHLEALGLATSDKGELRLRPAVTLEVSDGGGKTVISVKVSLVVVDGDGHLDMLQGSAKASATGLLKEPRLGATAAKVIDAALRGPCEDLAKRLGRR